MVTVKVTALIEIPRVCSPNFLNCGQQSVQWLAGACGDVP